MGPDAIRKNISKLSVPQQSYFLTLILRFLLKSVGLYEWILRLPVLICGIISIYLGYKAGEIIGKDTFVGWMTAFFLALSEWHIFFSTNARGYLVIMMLGQVCFLKLLDQLKEDRENIIVSHNGTTFDFLFLKKMIMDLKQKGDNVSGIDQYTIIYVDTLLMSRRLLPMRSYYNQGSLCKTFNIPIDVSHRAMGDVMCLEQLYEKLMNVLKRDYNTLTGKIVEDFINLKI